jgi:pilus assembly protein CpaE
MAGFIVQGGKGGVGASLVAVNLAAALSGRDGTLLIDLDPWSGGDDLLLDLRAQHSWVDLLPVVGELTRTHLNRACVHYGSKLDFLGASTVWPTSSEWKSLPELLFDLESHYQRIVIDLPPWIEAVGGLELYRQRWYRLLVMTPDPAAMRAGRRWLEQLPLNCLGETRLIVNQYTELHPVSPSRIADSLGIELLGITPIDSRAVGYQINFGRCCVEDEQSQFGRAMVRIAERLIGKSQAGLTSPVRKSLAGLRET